jgi:hypothetical protein
MSYIKTDSRADPNARYDDLGLPLNADGEIAEDLNWDDDSMWWVSGSFDRNELQERLWQRAKQLGKYYPRQSSIHQVATSYGSPDEFFPKLDENQLRLFNGIVKLQRECDERNAHRKPGEPYAFVDTISDV